METPRSKLQVQGFIVRKETGERIPFVLDLEPKEAHKDGSNPQYNDSQRPR